MAYGYSGYDYGCYDDCRYGGYDGYGDYRREPYGYGYGGYDYGGDWYRLLRRQVNDNVLVILTSGGRYSAVSGILTRVYPEYIVLINGNVILEIPMNRIATVSKLAGGGPVAPAPGSVAGFPVK